jgi:hypothetical protein
VTYTVCLLANAIYYPEGGGHLWVYLNWALGFRAIGCRVIWLEEVGSDLPPGKVGALVEALRTQLEPYDLARDLVVCSTSGEPVHTSLVGRASEVERAFDADLLFDMHYHEDAALVRHFRRSALLDIDPGLTQIWMRLGWMPVAPHDTYFTTGETVGRDGCSIPDCGLRWHHVSPCVSLEHWPVRDAVPRDCFTTVTHWEDGEWIVDGREVYCNDKREGFLPFLTLPEVSGQPLELALHLCSEQPERRSEIEDHGWGTVDAYEVASTPATYQSYIQESRGEFSCAKPSCVRLQNAWVSDRTLCYLASGRPAIVQHTGRSGVLPDREGLLRFKDVQQAVECLELAASDYSHQCLLARQLVEERFDARRMAASVLERALP